MARILIIDDDATFGELMVRRLAKAKHEVSFKASPFGSLYEIKRGAYDVVIVDVNMPGLDGSNIVRLIRETGTNRSTRILLCSSMDLDELNRLSTTLMADGYISKSASASELLGKLAEVTDQPFGPQSRRGRPGNLGRE